MFHTIFFLVLSSWNAEYKKTPFMKSVRFGEYLWRDGRIKGLILGRYWRSSYCYLKNYTYKSDVAYIRLQSCLKIKHFFYYHIDIVTYSRSTLKRIHRGPYPVWTLFTAHLNISLSGLEWRSSKAGRIEVISTPELRISYQYSLIDFVLHKSIIKVHFMLFRMRISINKILHF